MSEREQMLRKRCTDLINVPYVLLTYFRSGTTFTKHVIERCGGQVIHFHQLPMAIRNDYLGGKKLILLLRDYKECIMSNLWTRDVTKIGKADNSFISWAFSSGPEVEKRGMVYIQHLEHYDSWPNEKLLIYYEDIIRNPEELQKVLRFMELDCTVDLAEEMGRCHYDHLRFSGKNLHYHSEYVQDIGYFDTKMKQLSGRLWKYISRYEFQSHQEV